MRTQVIIIVLLAVAAAASCFSDRSAVLEPNGDPCTVPGSAVHGNTAIVLIRGFSFLQDTVRIQRGMSVTWVNCEQPNIEPHTSTSDTNAWDSGSFGPGESYTQPFNSAGTFSYFCRPHPTMRGVVIVS
jgi:plastocyanin